MADASDLARRFHEAYEELAPSFGYKTREASAKPWDDVPEQNKALMTAVCSRILAEFTKCLTGEIQAERAKVVALLDCTGHTVHHDPVICSKCREQANTKG